MMEPFLYYATIYYKPLVLGYNPVSSNNSRLVFSAKTVEYTVPLYRVFQEE